MRSAVILRICKLVFWSDIGLSNINKNIRVIYLVLLSRLSVR
uniref:Uncharacterized protein n=1 Tax=Anguilla anguilla TaxID=7936 RepID=A0A0E9SMP5_ANGAN